MANNDLSKTRKQKPQIKAVINTLLFMLFHLLTLWGKFYLPKQTCTLPPALLIIQVQINLLNQNQQDKESQTMKNSDYPIQKNIFYRLEVIHRQFKELQSENCLEGLQFLHDKLLDLSVSLRDFPQKRNN